MRFYLSHLLADWVYLICLEIWTLALSSFMKYDFYVVYLAGL